MTSCAPRFQFRCRPRRTRRPVVKSGKWRNREAKRRANDGPVATGCDDVVATNYSSGSGRSRKHVPLMIEPQRPKRPQRRQDPNHGVDPKATMRPSQLSTSCGVRPTPSPMARNRAGRRTGDEVEAKNPTRLRSRESYPRRRFPVPGALGMPSAARSLRLDSLCPARMPRRDRRASQLRTYEHRDACLERKSHDHPRTDESEPHLWTIGAAPARARYEPGEST